MVASIYELGAQELKEGTLCYVEFDKNDELKVFVPVIISRRLYQKFPAKLLESSLHPATKIEHLSPADRAFGWVNQQGYGAYRGQVRISEVQYEKCLSGEAISEFTNGLPLAILGQPKPQQARFYIAKNQQGEPLETNTSKEAGYKENQRLRGRKVYPHHQGTTGRGDWNNPMEDRTQLDDCYQEYRRPKLNDQEQQDNQNRSITGWVNPGTIFNFDIDVVNLSPVELGALLWLLDLQKYQGRDHFHRLGGGKPLGFGSVRIKVDWSNTDLRQGQDWRSFYSSLLPTGKPDSTQASTTVETFQQAIASAYKQDFINVPFIAAFLQAAKGFNDGKPVHYPRIQRQPNPNGEGFEWFVANESANGLRLSLPFLVNDPGLPLNPQIEKQSN